MLPLILRLISTLFPTLDPFFAHMHAQHERLRDTKDRCGVTTETRTRNVVFGLIRSCDQLAHFPSCAKQQGRFMRFTG